MPSASLKIRPLNLEDGQHLSSGFAAIGWSKPVALFERYREEQDTGARWVGVADLDGRAVGYVTIVWRSEDPVFGREGVPEIVDLNVLPAYRRRGVATALMDAAEAEALARGPSVGLRVGLHSGYGAAQQFYVRRGYVPDGSGAIRAGAPVAEGESVPLDDELTIRMFLAPGRARQAPSDEPDPPSTESRETPE